MFKTFLLFGVSMSATAFAGWPVVEVSPHSPVVDVGPRPIVIHPKPKRTFSNAAVENLMLINVKPLEAAREAILQEFKDQKVTRQDEIKRLRELDLDFHFWIQIPKGETLDLALYLLDETGEVKKQCDGSAWISMAVIRHLQAAVCEQQNAAVSSVNFGDQNLNIPYSTARLQRVHDQDFRRRSGNSSR